MAWRKIIIPLVLAALVLLLLAVVIHRRRNAPVSAATPSSPPGPTSSSGPGTSPAGDFSFSLKIGYLNRTYLVHVPASYHSGSPAPLVLAFHGGGGSAGGMATHYNWKQESDRKNFIVVFPQGTSGTGGFSTWNAGSCCGYAQRNNVDDVGFVKAIIGDAEARFSVDKSRIFATGMSNGGMMAYRLAAGLPGQLRAIASVAGTDNYNSPPLRPVSVLHIHSRDDEKVPFNGGAGNGLTAGLAFNSVPATIAKWVGIDGCNAAPRRVFDNAGAYCDLYSGGRNGAEVELCVTPTGGHSWPGGLKPRAGADTPSDAFSATDVIWNFFQQQK